MYIGSLFKDEAEDRQWLLSMGREIAAAAGSRLIEEDKPAGAMFVVLDGVVRVHSPRLGDKPIAELGPGEIVGDVSFITGGRAAASVTALEDSMLIELPVAECNERILRDNGFALRFYKMISRILALRLVNANAGSQGELEHSGQEPASAWKKLEAALGVFKDKMQRADRLMIERKPLPDALPGEVCQAFDAIVREMHLRIGDNDLSVSVRQELGRRVQKELLPWLLLSDTAECCYFKPRGYAGDYAVIERLYANQPHGAGRLGALVDLCFLNTVPANIVRGRRKLFAEEIAATARAKGDSARICVLASGPASEVFDAFGLIGDPAMLEATLVDFDAEALAFVAGRRQERNLEQSVRLINENLMSIALGRKKVALSGQDLVYSLGLIDYFNDKLVVKLLNAVHDLLRPGGRVILGNYHAVNPARELMDHVLDWKLIHRTEADMDRLFGESAFGRPSARIWFEAQGVDMFAECEK